MLLILFRYNLVGLYNVQGVVMTCFFGRLKLNKHTFSVSWNQTPPRLNLTEAKKQKLCDLIRHFFQRHGLNVTIDPREDIAIQMRNTGDVARITLSFDVHHVANPDLTITEEELAVLRDNIVKIAGMGRASRRDIAIDLVDLERRPSC